MCTCVRVNIHTQGKFKVYSNNQNMRGLSADFSSVPAFEVPERSIPARLDFTR